MIMDRTDDIRLVVEELRQAFADERRAIAALDAESLERATDLVRRCCVQLRDLIDEHTAPDTDLQYVLAAVRAEAQANASLARIANQAVRGVLGQPETGGVYDRRARPQTQPTTPIRILATY
jgi:hypothetical protein